ncbi:MAG: GSU2403 family nucleotidyltransferase fold protein, partial [Enhydrobacter sp.]
MALVPFSDEQARVLVNLEVHYKVWIEAEQALAELPYDLRRKQIASRTYLYEIHDRSGNGKSLGPWSPDQEARFRNYHDNKSALKTRREESLRSLTETARLCRALRVPMLADAAGPLLQEADRRRLLDRHLLVVGTSAMPAYAVEAGGFIRDAPDETQDFDMAWSWADAGRQDPVVWPMLKAVDPTFRVNSERTFQARND